MTEQGDFAAILDLGAETVSPATDPYLQYVQGTLLGEHAADATESDELARLRVLADEVEHDVSRLTSGADDDGDWLPPMAPEWFSRWINCDLDNRLQGTQQVGRNAVLIDNTTIDLVASYVQHGYPPSPVGLLDLANFVNNRVLRDELFALDHRLGSRSIGRDIEHEIAPLSPRHKEIIGAALLWIYRQCSPGAVSSPERAEVARTWSAILGQRAPTIEEMFEVPLEHALYYFNAPRTTSSGDNGTPGLIDGLFEDQAELAPDRLLRAVQAANCRSLLNLEAAREYNVAYAGGVTRLPMKRLLWRRGRHAEALAASINESELGTVRVLDAEHRRRVTAALASHQQSIVLPVFLTAVLARISRLDEFYECVDDLHSEATPLRKCLVDIEAALDSTEDRKEINKLLRAFRDDSEILRRTLWEALPPALAAAGVVLTAATGQPDWLLVAPMALIRSGEKMSSTTWRRIFNRFRRRHLWFLTEVGSVTSSLADMPRQLDRLWGPHFDHQVYGTQLDSLRSLGTL